MYVVVHAKNVVLFFVTAPAAPVAPVEPLAPLGSGPALTSAVRRLPFLTLPDVTALALSCAVPTLLLAIATAA